MNQLKRAQQSGFTLLELMIAGALAGILCLFIVSLLTTSAKENQRFSQSLANTNSSLSFKKYGNDVIESAGASVEYLHLPISFRCDPAHIEAPCVRTMMGDQFKAAVQFPVTLEAGNAPAKVIEFFRDEACLDDTNHLGQMRWSDSATNERKLSNLTFRPNAASNDYAVWPLMPPDVEHGAGPRSTNPFVLLRYSKDNLFFTLDDRTVGTNAVDFGVYQPSPAINGGVGGLVNRLYVIASQYDQSKYFIGNAVAAQACAGGQCVADITAFGKDALPGDEQLLKIRFGGAPSLATLMNGSATPSPLAGLSQNIVDPAVLSAGNSNHYLFPTRHLSFYDIRPTQTTNYFPSISNDNLPMKFGDLLRSQGTSKVVAAPIEFSSVFLESRACSHKTEKNCTTLVMETYCDPANSTRVDCRRVTLMDELPPNAFVLVTRRLGSSELNFRVFSQKPEEILVP